MPALRYDLVVDQGSDYARAIPVRDDDDQPVSVAGWSVSGQIRAGHSAPDALVELDLAIAGTSILLRISAAASTDWTWRLGRYDIELTDPDGAVTRFAEGAVVVRPQITHL